MQTIKNDEIRQKVRESYANVANSNSTLTSSCCGTSETKSNNVNCCSSATSSPEEESFNMGYSKSELVLLPDGANMGLGCGNPQAIASLKSGETVLDLGSGGGIDCFLAANAVGDDGHVIGIDMTPEMVSKARENTVKSGFTNIEFRLGEIENLPVADNTVDVIMSNCVINLSPDKQQVFNDSLRILKSGGRLAISDVVATAKLPDELLNDPKLYSACVSGAVQIEVLESMLEKAGFIHIQIKPKVESKEFIREWAPGSNIEDYVVSATIEAVKP
ncbi:arsenite methyltransferase [Thiotrichales bacterium HSG1]|nr:arsenite methyltransferase [Thiotrichales bacterium HSG1]